MGRGRVGGGRSLQTDYGKKVSGNLTAYLFLFHMCFLFLAS